MKRIISAVFVLLLTAALLSGCGTAEPATEPTTENAAGGIQIAEGVTYVQDFESESDPPVGFPPQDAAKALYEQALVNLFDESDYGKDNPLVIREVGLFDIEGSGECYLFNVSDYENSFAVSYEGAVYEILFGKGIRAWGETDMRPWPQTEPDGFD
jgi:hypothetical protein